MDAMRGARGRPRENRRVLPAALGPLHRHPWNVVTDRHIPFASLIPGEQERPIRDAIDRVVKSGWFVLGPEVAAFEAAFAEASGAKHAVGVGNGTDAIALTLRALGIGEGDEVITTPLSAAYTALAVLMVGA